MSDLVFFGGEGNVILVFMTLLYELLLNLERRQRF